MFAKADSEVSSLSQSSPARSPRPPVVYYVQSPSRDSSNDGEKTTNSFQSTPTQSPLGSPPHSRNSSSSTSNKGPWKDIHFHTINEEEGLLDDSHALPRRCYFLAFLLAFLLFFSLFSLILWGASRPQKPAISLESITFDRFIIQAGADVSGVATSLVSINSSMRMTFRNTATFFGVHVTPTPVYLNYYQLTLATGNMPKFYESRKSQRSIRVMLEGTHVPLYGGGASLRSVNGLPVHPVPFTLSVMVRSSGYVLGKLVKPNFNRNIKCAVVMDPNNMGLPVPLKNKCT